MRLPLIFQQERDADGRDESGQAVARGTQPRSHRLKHDAQNRYQDEKADSGRDEERARAVELAARFDDRPDKQADIQPPEQRPGPRVVGAQAVAQRTIGQPLDKRAQKGAAAHAQQQDNDILRDRPAVRQDRRDCEQADIRAHHIHVAVREVDELQHAVDHRVANGDQGVHTADLNAVDELLQKDLQRLRQKRLLKWSVAGKTPSSHRCYERHCTSATSLTDLRKFSADRR